MQIITEDITILSYALGQLLIEKEIIDTFVVLTRRGMPVVVGVKCLKEYADMPHNKYLNTQIAFNLAGNLGIVEMYVTYYPRPSSAVVSDAILCPFKLNKLDELADIIGKVQITALEKSDRSWRELRHKRLFGAY